MAICIYDPNATDFSTNGMGLLTPKSCTVSAEDGGMFELELVQPIDATLRWAQLQKGCIIKAPVPTRESPLYEEIEDVYDTQPVTVQREIYVVHNTSVGVYMRSGPGKGYKNFGYLKNGAEVVLLEKTSSSWYHVCVVKGGRVCYMHSKYLKYARSDEEIIQQGQVVGQRVIEYMQSQDQLFRIYSVERDSKAQVVKAKAMHVFYDQRANIVNAVYDPENVPLSTALQEVYAKLMCDSGFQLHIAAGLDTKITGSYGYKNPVECMLDPEEGMLPQANALLVRDNYDMYILPETTRDSGVTIRRGKNLRGVTVTDDASDIVTRIIPCGKNKDGEDLFLDGTGYVDSPHINEHPFPYVQKIDYDCKTASSKKEADGETSFASDAETRAQLRKLAEEDFSKNGVDLPSYGMKVDFLLLQNTAEYANYASLQAVYLHDTVTVIDSVIGVKAKVRVNAYSWNCLTLQYDSVNLGDVSSLEQTVYSYSLPTGGVSGTKITPGTASGEILRNASIQYAKISVAAIDQLSAQAITALTARIQEIVAQRLTTDELYAAYAEMIALKVGTIDAGNIQTDALAAELARITVLAAGTASFDQATVAHLVAQAMNLEYGVAGQVFIKNLAVEYAQMVGAAIGNLCIRASDGNYYRIDVRPDGTVSAVKTTVSAGEIAAGQTEGGRVILETSITAANLNAGNLLATYALVNKIDAARIDVDALFAREAFIKALTTSRIFGGESLEIIAGRANEAVHVFRQEDFPDGTVWVEPGDMLIKPSTGQVYQAVQTGTLSLFIDNELNVYYEYDGVGRLVMDGLDLYADGFVVSISEDGSVGTPYNWELVQDSELAGMANAAQSAADAAQGTADAAQSAADTAQGTADAASNYANEALDIANAALSQADFKRVVRIDDTGLHVGDNLTDYEVLLDSASVNVVAAGVRVSTFSDKFIRLDNMQIRKVRGGMAISVYKG